MKYAKKLECAVQKDYTKNKKGGTKEDEERLFKRKMEKHGHSQNAEKSKSAKRNKRKGNFLNMKKYIQKLKKQNKGITLIALIITIIVLLILAGVTIAMLTGSDSAPAKANEAKQKDDIGALKDEISLFVQNKHMELYDDIYVKTNTTTSSISGSKAKIGSEVIGAVRTEFAEKTKNGVAVTLTQETATSDAVIELATRDFKQPGTISYEGGTLLWQALVANNGTQQQGNDPEEPATSNLSLAEKTALTTNGMAELSSTDIDNDSNLTSDQKTALKDTTKVKAVLTGNVPVPVGYDYVEGTSTAITKPTDGSYGVVIQDANDNQWVWVPVNSNESIAPSAMYENVDNINVGNNKKENNENKIKLELAKNINGLKIASINKFPSLKVAEEDDEEDDDSSSSEESVPSYYTTVTTKKKSASILDGYDRGDPNNTSTYREPALVTDYDLNSTYYTQAGNFGSAEEFANAMVNDYNAMITSITKYGGFYVGRYELSGTNNGNSNAITNAKVQAGQAPMDNVNWYRLYQACRTFETSTTTSTMIWGTQWDVVCRWTNDSGDQVSYSSYHSNAHSNNYNATTGSNANDIRNNVYDLEGCRFEWTQEASNTDGRAIRGDYYGYDGYGSASGYNYVSPNGDYYNNYGSRPSLYIK